MTDDRLVIVCFSLAILFLLLATSFGVNSETENTDSENSIGRVNAMGCFLCFFVIFFAAHGSLIIIGKMREGELKIEDRARHKGWSILRRGWKFYPDGFTGERIRGNNPPKQPTLDNLNKAMDEMKNGKGL